MIQINNIYFGCELHDILIKLQSELHSIGSPYLSKIKVGATHIQITCPYHSDGMERRPSAGIRKVDGLFHCFTCGEVHSLPEVVSHCFDYDDGGVYGTQWLMRNFSILATGVNRNVKFDIKRNATVSKKSIKFVDEEELDSYRYVHPYMYQRGLTDEIIDLFDIGYDRNTDCLTFPVRDVSGNCLFVARRSVKTKFFQYPEGVEKPLYGLYELYHHQNEKIYNWWVIHRTIIVCESMLDALSFWTVGKNAVALNGLGNSTQFKQLRELPVREIILATDMDERGLQARDRIRKNMQNTKIIAEYFFPKGRKDANDCTKEELISLEAVF